VGSGGSSIQKRGAMYKNPILRCDASGASGHVTAKLSIRNWGAFYKSGAYAWNVLCLTPGGLCVV
jgi:hypothetical protein